MDVKLYGCQMQEKNQYKMVGMTGEWFKKNGNLSISTTVTDILSLSYMSAIVL